MTTAIDPVQNSVITSDEALRIARIDAETMYQDLKRFRIEVTVDDEGWHVKYRVAHSSHGGGPHYIVDAATGEILWKRYYQ